MTDGASETASRHALGAMRKIVLPVVWLVGVLAAAMSGFRSNPYLEHVQHMPPPHPYPTDTVVAVIVLMTVQSALLMVVLRPTSCSFSWGRALLALVVSCGFPVLGAMGSMHAPPPWGAYLVWLLVLVLAMLILSVGSAIGAARARPGT